MNLRVAKKILKNQGVLKYGEHQTKKADSVIKKAIKNGTKAAK
jgi:hypothetical protein